MSTAAPGRDRSRGLLDQVLEHWGLGDPGPPCAALVDRFHAEYITRVPFENLTKLIKAVRHRGTGASVRAPVEFWQDHLRLGSGGTCFAATSACHFLLRYAGIPSKLLFCHLPAEEPQAHAALWVPLEGRDLLVDVGYALPAPVELNPEAVTRRKTPYADIEVRPGPGGEFLVFTEDDRGPKFRYRFKLEAAKDEAYQEAWKHTFDLSAPYMRRLALGRFTNDTRYLYKNQGTVYRITRAGETELPLPADDPVPALAEMFALPAPLLRAAMAALGTLEKRRTG